MRPQFKQAVLAAAFSPALVMSAPLNAQTAGPQATRQDIAQWDASSLYTDGWTAEEMIGTPVRDENGEDIGNVKDLIVDGHGNISRLVVEVGGLLELGSQHIGVPWKDIKIGEDMSFVEVPLREVRSGAYSLYGEVPQGEQVAAGQGTWRANELIGDYASLPDVPRFGLVTDLVFNNRGQVKGVVVEPGVRGAIGRRYAFPFAGYDPGAFAYPLPYRREAIAQLQPFDYARLAEQSRYSSGRTLQARRDTQGASASSGGASAKTK